MKKKDLLKRLSDHCFCRIQPSKIHGVGVFAVKDIPKGICPWVTNSHTSLEIHQLSSIKVKKLDKPVKDMIYDYNLKTVHGFFIPPYELEIFHIVQFLNSSKTPNLELAMEEREGKIQSIYKTLREIKTEEELTVDFENQLKDFDLEMVNLNK